jgi:serine/threonine protein kinase
MPNIFVRLNYMVNNDSLIGKQIGNYLLTKMLGDGAFGRVYLAEHRFLSRSIVALKILKSTYLDADEEKKAFFDEAKCLDILKHRHILPILDAGMHEDRPYMVIEYASKGSLRDHIASQRPARLPMREALLILSQIGQALQYVHRYNIVHRDLKPANILFNEREEALLADFGIAVQLKEGTDHAKNIVGTFPYMAPEQFDGMISEKSDQYALACIAYELFAGHTPLTASPKADYPVWYHKSRTEEPLSPLKDNPELGSDRAEAILRALSKDRDKRYPDISAFISAMISETELLEIPDMPTMLVNVAALQNIHSEPQKTVEEWLADADDHHKNQRWEEALAAYEQAIQLGYESADTYFIQGSILYDLKRLNEALMAYDRAIQLGYKDAVVHYRRGYILHLLERHEEALTAYEQAIQLDPTNASFYGGKGNVFRELKRYADAQQAYEEAIRLSPHTPIFHINRGDVLFTLKEFERSVDAYDQAIKVASKSGIKSKAYVGKATVLLRLRRDKEAIAAYERATSLDPSIVSPALYLAKGDAFWRCSLDQSALEAYEQGLALDPQNGRLQQKISAMQDIIRRKYRRA